MRYALCNLYFTGDSFLDQTVTNDILKTIPYNAKIKNKKTNQYSFLYILFSINDSDELNEIDTNEIDLFISTHFPSLNNYLNDKYKIGNQIEKLFHTVKDLNFSLDLVSIIDENDLDIFYTDGSSSSKKDAASWACVHILEKSYDEDALFDLVTESSRKYSQKSGYISKGTNNVGELTGIKEAIKSNGQKQFQVIISDSEYSIKSFREWIHNWKINNYKGSNKKTILNCDIIKEIQELIESNNKIYLFGWTKGHDETPFNELCDQLAKQELGI